MNIPYVKGKPIFTNINKKMKQYPYIQENLDTEVIVIGGGVTGAILGYYFTKSNIPCVILEKDRIGHCSTSITTALLQYELDGNLEDLRQYTSLENSLNVYKLGKVALDEIDKIINEYGNNCNYKKRDTLLYTSKSVEEEALKREYDLRRENGFDVDFINEKNNPFSFDIKGGVYSINGGAEIDPYLFNHKLLDIATSKGLKVYENTEVVKVNYLDNEVEVETKYNYKVRGKIVIVATGYNTSMFTNRSFGTKYTTFNIVTSPIENLEEWYNRVLIRDNKQTYNYYRTTFDNRIIAGGEDVNFVPDIFNEEIALEKYDILMQKVKDMFPSSKNAKIDYSYCGAFASTKDNVGFIGKDPDKNNLWYCLGYGANGILFSMLGGLMLPKLYKGEYDKNLNLFKVDRFD